MTSQASGGQNGQLQLPDPIRARTFSGAGMPSQNLNLSTIPVPTLPTAAYVLVRVCSASLHPGGSIVMQLVPFLFRKSLAVAETGFSGFIVAASSKVQNSSSEGNNIDPKRQFSVEILSLDQYPLALTESRAWERSLGTSSSRPIPLLTSRLTSHSKKHRV